MIIIRENTLKILPHFNLPVTTKRWIRVRPAVKKSRVFKTKNEQDKTINISIFHPNLLAKHIVFVLKIHLNKNNQKASQGV